MVDYGIIYTLSILPRPVGAIRRANPVRLGNRTYRGVEMCNYFHISP